MCNPIHPERDGTRASSTQDIEQPEVKAHNWQSAQRKVVNLHDTMSIVLFDWDDTLFPTSALTAYGPEKIASALEMVDGLVADLLAGVLATPLNQVVLLTNARSGWVNHCLQEFLPKVNELLTVREAGRIQIVSAMPAGKQDPSSPTYAAEVAMWKKTAAYEHIRPVLLEKLGHIRASMLQVLSIGDSHHDLDAGHALNAMLRAESSVQESFVKTVLLKSRPNAGEVVGQLRSITKAFRTVLMTPRNCHHSLAPNANSTHSVGQSRPALRPETEANAGASSGSPIAVADDQNVAMAALRPQADTENVLPTASTDVMGAGLLAPERREGKVLLPIEGSSSGLFSREFHPMMVDAARVVEVGASDGTAAVAVDMGEPRSCDNRQPQEPEPGDAIEDGNCPHEPPVSCQVLCGNGVKNDEASSASAAQALAAAASMKEKRLRQRRQWQQQLAFERKANSRAQKFQSSHVGSPTHAHNRHR